MNIRVLGGGVAGSAAALAAVREGAQVELWEQSRLPRHKVCGEFLSGEMARVWEHLGVLGQVEAAGPARLRWLRVRMGKAERKVPLPEAGYGLSRYTMDALMVRAAEQQGVRLMRGRGVPEGVTILATGREAAGAKGRRLFGFKAHFRGPVDDGVALYFFGPESYAGVSAVEGGITNVCGLAPEADLARVGFDVWALLQPHVALMDRLRPLHQVWDWMKVGPLVYGEQRMEAHYRAGDALAFVDPFTGSGMLRAALSGQMAGVMAARGAGVVEYRGRVGGTRRGSMRAAAIRLSIKCGIAPHLLPLIPMSLLYSGTRPK